MERGEVNGGSMGERVNGEGESLDGEGEGLVGERKRLDEERERVDREGKGRWYGLRGIMNSM
eukprot:97619-Amorphochlora_amoeboformis.AAC.2